MVEVTVSRTKNGVYLYFPTDYMKQLYGDQIPEYITLMCDGREVKARFVVMNGTVARYRVYGRYVITLMESDECQLVVEQKA